MSSPEPVTAERAYRTLKEEIVFGTRRPGFILNLQPLADELAISVTPVRDAIHRLVGEGLVELQLGGGFVVPRPRIADLYQLYDWNDQIVRLALRAPLPQQDLTALSDMIPEEPTPEQLAHMASSFFALAAASTGNQRFVQAIANASDRLLVARLAEPQAVRAMAAEMKALISTAKTSVAAAARKAVREYHRRRLVRIERIAAAIILT